MDSVAEGREDGVESDYDSDDDSIIIKLLIPARRGLHHRQGRLDHQRVPDPDRRAHPAQPQQRNLPRNHRPLVTLGGTAQAILGAMHPISKLIADGEGIVDGNPQVKVVIPNVSCGCIIGKGGATIRSFTEDSGADIKLSSRIACSPGDGSRAHRHRTIDTVLRAVALVATALMDDDSYASRRAPSTYATHVNLPVGGIARSSFDAGRARRETGGRGRVSITVAVPDEHIGAVLGKGGRTISEIQVVSGVRIKVSDRGDFVEGTRNRKVTLTGRWRGRRWRSISSRRN